MAPVVTNAESCRRYRERQKQDTERCAKQREQTRERTRRYRERRRGLGPAADPQGRIEANSRKQPRNRVLPAGDVAVNDIIDRVPKPAEPLARVRWKHWREIREKELTEGRRIFQGTCPDDLERYRLRFGLPGLAAE